MPRMPGKVLFMTSFFRVAALKSIARPGEATWGQARIAVIIGFGRGVAQ
ncbi:MAG: hypothetical protein ABSF48_26290 [Thermodesulfobacteriota bacterium]|jgi:hypothetical protein